MTVQLMHIAVRQILQRMGADFYGQVDDGAMDFWLNKTEDSLVTTMASALSKREGLSMSDHELLQAYKDMLQPIIVKSKRLECSASNDGEASPAIKHPRFDAILPPDYDHLILDRSNVKWDCVDFNISSSNSVVAANKELYIAIFTFDDNHGFEIYNGSNLVYSTSNYSFNENLSDQERHETINHFIIWSFTDENLTSGGKVVPVYWERYGSIYRRSSFIVVTESETLRDAIKIKYIIDNTTANLVRSPSFESASDWVTPSAWAIAGGIATFTAGSGTQDMEQVFSTPIDTSKKNYTLKIKVDSISTSLLVGVQISGVITSVGVITTVGTSSVDLPTDVSIEKLVIRGSNAGGSFTISFVQISIGSMKKESTAFTQLSKTYASGAAMTSPNSLQRNEFIYNSLKNPMRTTTPEYPLSLLTSNRIHVFASKRFIVNEVIIDYVRLRRRISLSLNQSTELPALANKIVAETASSLHEALQSGSYQTSLLESKKSN